MAILEISTGTVATSADAICTGTGALRVLALVACPAAGREQPEIPISPKDITPKATSEYNLEDNISYST